MNFSKRITALAMSAMLLVPAGLLFAAPADAAKKPAAKKPAASAAKKPAAKKPAASAAKKPAAKKPAASAAKKPAASKPAASKPATPAKASTPAAAVNPKPTPAAPANSTSVPKGSEQAKYNAKVDGAVAAGWISKAEGDKLKKEADKAANNNGSLSNAEEAALRAKLKDAMPADTKKPSGIVVDNNKGTNTGNGNATQNNNKSGPVGEEKKKIDQVNQLVKDGKLSAAEGNAIKDLISSSANSKGGLTDAEVKAINQMIEFEKDKNGVVGVGTPGGGGGGGGGGCKANPSAAGCRQTPPPDPEPTPQPPPDPEPTPQPPPDPGPTPQPPPNPTKICAYARTVVPYNQPCPPRPVEKEPITDFTISPIVNTAPPPPPVNASPCTPVSFFKPGEGPKKLDETERQKGSNVNKEKKNNWPSGWNNFDWSLNTFTWGKDDKDDKTDKDNRSSRR